MDDAFTTWAKNNGLNWDLTFCPHGGYADEGVGMAYLSWQAATAHTRHEMVERLEKPEVLDMVGTAITKQCDFTYNMGKSAALAALSEIKKLLMEG